MRQEKKIHYAWVMLIVCCAISLGSAIIVTNGSNFLHVVAAELEVGIGTLTVYITIMSLTMAALFPTASKLLGGKMKSAILLGGICQYIAFGLMGTFQQVYQFYIAGFLIGVGGSITMFLAIPALLNMWFIEKKGFAMGVAMAFPGIAGALISPLVGVSISVIGWRMSYYLFAAIGLIIFIPVILLFLKTPEQKKLKPYGYCGDMKVEADTNNDKETGMTVTEARKSTVLYVMFVFSAVMASITAISAQVSTIASAQYGLSQTMAATMLSMYCLGGVVGNIGLGALNDRFGHMFTLVLGIVFILLSQGLLYISTFVPQLIMPTGFIFGMSLALYSILPPLMTGQIFGYKEYNRIWAYIMSAGCLVSSVATPIYGTIYDKTGSYTGVFVLISILAIIALLCGIFSLKSSKERAQFN